MAIPLDKGRIEYRFCNFSITPGSLSMNNKK